MAMRLGADYPTTEFLREFAVHLRPGDTIIKRLAVLKLELAVKVDFKERSALCSFCTVKLIPPVATSSPSVVELVESVTKNLRRSKPLRIKLAELGSNAV